MAAGAGKQVGGRLAPYLFAASILRQPRRLRRRRRHPKLKGVAHLRRSASPPAKKNNENKRVPQQRRDRK